MNGKMKAWTFIKPEEMVFEEKDIPQIGPDEVLVKVKAVGICGSDVSYYYGESPLETPDGLGPLVLGHEASGVIVEIGDIAKRKNLFKEGDRVAMNPVMQCNACASCLRGEFNECQHVETLGVSADGCFAEYVRVKYTHAYKISDDISFEEGALAEPLACATYGVTKLDIKLGQTVVIFGTGTIGLMQVQIARAGGAGKIIVIGIEDFGLSKALEVGANYAINSLVKDSPYYAADIVEKVKEYNNGELAPRAIVPTSAMVALQQALTVTGPHATVVYFGLPGEKDMLQVPVLETITSDKTLKFSWLAPLVWDNVFNLIAAKKVDLGALTTHKFPLEEVEKGIKFMRESKENKIKGEIVLD